MIWLVLSLERVARRSTRSDSSVAVLSRSMSHKTTATRDWLRSRVLQSVTKWPCICFIADSRAKSTAFDTNINITTVSYLATRVARGEASHLVDFQKLREHGISC